MDDLVRHRTSKALEPKDAADLTPDHMQAFARAVAHEAFLLLNSFRSYPGGYTLFDDTTPDSLWEKYTRDHWDTWQQEEAAGLPRVVGPYARDDNGKVLYGPTVTEVEWRRKWVSVHDRWNPFAFESTYTIFPRRHVSERRGDPLPWPGGAREHAWTVVRMFAPEIVVRAGGVPDLNSKDQPAHIAQLTRYVAASVEAAYGSMCGSDFLETVRSVYAELERARDQRDLHGSRAYVARIPELRVVARELFERVYDHSDAKSRLLLGSERGDVVAMIAHAETPDQLFEALQMITVPSDRRVADARPHAAELASAKRNALHASRTAPTRAPAPAVARGAGGPAGVPTPASPDGVPGSAR